MASLRIRKLDDETYERLRARAIRHGISMEEEIRQILRKAVAPPERLGDLFLKVFGPDRGADPEVSSRGPHEPMDFESQTQDPRKLTSSTTVEEANHSMQAGAHKPG